MGGAPELSRIGEIVGGKYRIVRLLARGGMGVVYEAQHAVVHRRFAIKFLRRDLAERRDILSRFQREAAAAGALENDNVAAAVDFGISDDGTPYIVMEYLVGESLGVLLERHLRLPVGRAADLLVQACRGVAAAHAAGIVHRDLKPHNLFVCRRDDGTDLLKVLDFGVAKLQAIDEASADTRTGTMLGTAAYMSPEQARGDRTVDGRTDVYALGAIVYELLSGKRPHPGDSQNAVLHHIATHPAVPLDSLQADLPPDLVAVVTGALEADPAARPASAQLLGEQLAPFAQRQVWPAPAGARDPSGPIRADQTATVMAPGHAAGRPAPRAQAWRRWAAAVAAVAIVAGVLRHLTRPPVERVARRIGGAHVLEPGTRFLSGDPEPGAVRHLESLLNAGAARDAALLSAMLATPAAFWLLGGTPQQVRLDVADILARAGRQGRLPVLVAYNHPFRDCTGYGLIGAADTASYEAWIDGIATGIGNEKAVVLLEPNSLGLVPYGNRLDGVPDRCRPTHADAEGNRVAAPGATPEERYAQLAYAIDTMAARAPNAAVYVDGTHSDWLPAGEAAYRLMRAGVDRAAGFFLNAGNYQPTDRLIQYGTWISKCLHHAQVSAAGAASPLPYRECASVPEGTDPPDAQAWARVDDWYAAHVDHGPHPPSPGALTHFVINTNRNGRGPLDTAAYARPPYNQPPAVTQALRNGSWCMPPGRGLGLPPTADTHVPLVDAYLWTDTPGLTVASCDIAGGARAWDFSKYNPWGLTGEAQNHFDPLWGRVLPPPGQWFPDEAMQLARHANPPLETTLPANLEDRAHTDVVSGAPRVDPAPQDAGVAAAGGRPPGRPPGHKKPAGRPPGQVALDAGTPQAAGPPAPAPAAPATRGDGHPAPRPAFDSDNPYR